LLTTLYTALNNKFKSTRIITEASQSDDADLLVTYDIKFVEVSSDSWSGKYAYACLLKLDFIIPNTKLLLATFIHKEQMIYTPPGTATAASVLEGLSLFLLTPLTAPVKTQAIGNRAVKLIELAIKESVVSVMNKIDLDPKLAAFSKSNSIVDKNTKGKQTLPVNRPPITPPSKYEDFLNAVVIIKTSKGFGSGFFISQDGAIITNRHVVGSEDKISIKIRNGLVLFGTVVFSDDRKDLSIIATPYKPECWLRLSKQGEGGIGAEVLAIGSPAGLSWSISRGIISAYRHIDGTEVIQTDAAINRGNSGGPLILLDNGTVVGVNTFGLKKNVTEGLNFAVSAQEIKYFISKFKKR
jgi:S1-C subfamily serine protease